MSVSLYGHDLISFGAIVCGMIATSGDEAFVMLVQFPSTALVLFGLLFVFGIIFAWISDKAFKILGITPCESCLEAQCEHCESGMDNHEPIAGIVSEHYLHYHIWDHIIKKHLSRVFYGPWVHYFLFI